MQSLCNDLALPFLASNKKIYKFLDYSVNICSDLRSFVPMFYITQSKLIAKINFLRCFFKALALPHPNNLKETFLFLRKLELCNIFGNEMSEKYYVNYFECFRSSFGDLIRMINSTVE